METSTDFFDLYHRFQRLEEVFRLGVSEFHADPRPDVRAALADVRGEALKVAEVALRTSADDDLWRTIDGAAGMWQRLAVLADQGTGLGLGTAEEVADVRRLAEHLVVLQHRAAVVTESLAELMAHPGDGATDAAVKVAIGDLLAAGDATVFLVLAAAGTRRLDAGVAVLMATAAAAGRAERSRLQLRGRAG